VTGFQFCKLDISLTVFTERGSVPGQDHTIITAKYQVHRNPVPQDKSLQFRYCRNVGISLSVSGEDIMISRKDAKTQRSY